MIDNTIFSQKKVAFHTLGCKLNFSETSTIARNLEALGFLKVNFDEYADIYILNTCSVTEVADKKCRQAIKKVMKINPDAFIVVTGCYAQLKPDSIIDIPGVNLVLGNNDKFNMASYLTNMENKAYKKMQVGKIAKDKKFHASYSMGDRTRTFLKIQDGCDYFCSFCTIPFARGRSRNANIESTVALANKAAAEGAKEIILTGVNIGDFGKTTNETFFDLVKQLDNVDGIERIRISSIEPNLLTDEIIEFVASSNKFMPHFHIPLQSGSNEVLKLMRRKYNKELFAHRIHEINRLIPDAFIGVDVIVGVRGETKEYFQNAYNFIKDLNISQLHVFTYSERPNTKALKIDYNVPITERKERSKILHKLSDEKTNAFYSKFTGKTMKVLLENSVHNNKMSGFSENYIKVNVDYNPEYKNTIQNIKLIKFNKELMAFD